MSSFRRKKDKNNEGNVGDFNPENFYYPISGVWKIADSIAENIKSKGGIITLNSVVKQLNTRDNRITEVIYSNDGQLKTVQCDYVVSTIPITQLVKLLNPVNEDILVAAQQLKYREVTFLFLVVKKPKVFVDVHWKYYQDSDLVFQRIYENKAFSEKTVPCSSQTGLCLEITNKDRLTEAELYAKAVEGLEKIGLLKEKDIQTYYVERKAYSYPIYTIDYEIHLRKLKDYIAHIENLINAGRQGLFRYVDMDHCIMMGKICAQHILHGKALGDLDAIVAAHGSS